MIVTRQMIVNLFSAVVTLGRDMTDEQKKHIDYDGLAQIADPRIAKDDGLDGSTLSTIEMQKMTMAEMLLELSKFPNES